MHKLHEQVTLPKYITYNKTNKLMLHAIKEKLIKSIPTGFCLNPYLIV